MTKSLKITAVALAATLAGAMTVVYFFVDPAQSKLMPRCLFKSLTGWDCPGCGSQRMLHALLHGDWAGAWHANPLLLSMVPYILLLGFASLFRTRYRRLYSLLNSPAAIAVIFTLMTLWFIGRNIF